MSLQSSFRWNGYFRDRNQVCDLSQSDGEMAMKWNQSEISLWLNVLKVAITRNLFVTTEWLTVINRRKSQICCQLHTQKFTLTTQNELVLILHFTIVTKWVLKAIYTTCLIDTSTFFCLCFLSNNSISEFSIVPKIKGIKLPTCSTSWATYSHSNTRLPFRVQPEPHRFGTAIPLK